MFEREFVIAQETEDFDEEWEKVLFRICYTRQRLKPRVTDISKFFSYIKDELLKDNEDNIGDIVASILSQTSVTSVTSTDTRDSRQNYLHGKKEVTKGCG